MIINYKKFINEKKYTKKELSDRFWDDNMKFDPKVRNKILEVVENFYDDLNVDIDIYDIKLTGSLSNYNYTKDSDLDIDDIW